MVSINPDELTDRSAAMSGNREIEVLHQPPERLDRRVARTRTALQQAHLRLILRQPFETITVEDICAEANVARSTFYLHFASKDDLKRSGFDEMRRQLAGRRHARAGAEGAHDPLGFSLALFEHANDHLELYRALAGGHGGAVALASIRDMLTDMVREGLGASGKDEAGDVAVAFVTGALMAVLTWWLDGGARQPPEQIDMLFRRLAMEGLGSLGGPATP